MSAFYRPKYFVIGELVPPETYAVLGDNSWFVLDPRAVITLDQLREEFGPCLVNNWFLKPDHTDRQGVPLYSYRGFRPSTYTGGAPLSQHRFGRAFDCTFKQPAEEVRQAIMKDPEKFPFLTALEADTIWVHFDVRDHGEDGIKIFKPQ